MSAFAIHNGSGDIDVIVVSSAGAPPVAAGDPGQFVSEVELPTGFSEVGDSEGEQRAAEALGNYRVQGTLLRRS